MIDTKGTITRLLGRWQAEHGNRVSQRRLAEITGISKDLLSNLDRGNVKQLPLDALDILCDALGCTPADILMHTPNNPPRASLSATDA